MITNLELLEKIMNLWSQHSEAMSDYAKCSPYQNNAHDFIDTANDIYKEILDAYFELKDRLTPKKWGTITLDEDFLNLISKERW
jgi:hypothetical protein